ncbi:MAG: hypothetical protein JXA13_15175 [Anaerolineales bacterium]|nr:hypothetical protein [Anaerolineales bacterium]
MHPAFQYGHYLLKRQVFALTGKFRYYNPSGELVMFSQQKMFKLKEDIRVYTDENKTQELLVIQARQIIDFSAAYDVVDASSNMKVGALRRRGLKSILRDEWEVLDVNDQPMGVIQEDSMGRAMLRRLLLGSLLPQDYDAVINGQRAADLKQRFNLFRYELDVTFEPGLAFDRRLGLAAGILLATVEGKQSS